MIQLDIDGNEYEVPADNPVDYLKFNNEIREALRLAENQRLLRDHLYVGGEIPKWIQ